MITRRERLVLALLVGAALVVRLAFGSAIPAFQAPDEQAHVHFVEYLVDHAQLPVQPPPDPALIVQRWDQFYQPPLAYLLYAPVELAARSLGATQEQRVQALRAQNAIYGAATAGVCFWVVALLTPPGDARRLLAGALVAFLPGLVGNTSAVNNDGLANLLAALLWVALLAPLERARTPWLIGGIFGLALLVKLTVLILAPVVLLVGLRRQADRLLAFRRLVLAGCLAALMLVPWCVRNAIVYGDPLAIGAGSVTFEWLASVFPESALTGSADPDPLKTFLQFWGRFGIYNNLRLAALPWLLAPLAAVALAGWARPQRRPLDALEREWPGFAAAIVLAFAGLASFSLRYYGGWQGRYLFPASVPIAALLAAGLARLLPAASSGALLAWSLASALLALDVALLVELNAFFSAVPPALWGAAHAL